MDNAVYSTMIRAGRTTYFLDVKEAKNGNKYLAIYQVKIDGEQKKQKTTLHIFGESLEMFKQAVNEAIDYARL